MYENLLQFKGKENRYHKTEGLIFCKPGIKPDLFYFTGKGLMKGFLLWFEENSQRVSEEENLLDDDRLRDKCLEMWQGLSSDNKKAYKTPRLPKRKREADDTQQSTTSKLAKFAAPKA